MLFNSWIFCIFVIITGFIYYLPFMKRFQLGILILASFIFYAFKHPEFLLLLIFSSLLNSIFSYIVISTNTKNRKLWAILGVVLNLVLLSFFKYGTLIYSTFFSSINIGEWILAIPLPIGISFYTFQGISLLVDVFKNEKEVLSKNTNLNLFDYVRNTVFFISFFPHSVAGPIVKAHDFLPQIKPKYFNDIDWDHIFKTLVVGYFFKMVIADNLQNYTFFITYPYFLGKSTLTLIVMLFGYSCQIFADFAGYSLIALGIAAFFGYRLPTNFNFPYISQSFSEFWKRWHMSLSSWLKEYLYIPLGGNRKGKLLTYVNLMIVMFLGGLWHGAAWRFLVWGGAHGVALAGERFWYDYHGKPKNNSFWWQLIRIVFVFSVVSWAWLLFKLPELSQVVFYSKAILENIGMSADWERIGFIALYSMPVFLYHVWAFLKEKKVVAALKAETFVYGLLLFLIIMNSGDANAFIYFQF
jgi:alginate O-acetyltransferase complex protein AlgI